MQIAYGILGVDAKNICMMVCRIVRTESDKGLNRKALERCIVIEERLWGNQFPLLTYASLNPVQHLNIYPLSGFYSSLVEVHY